MHNLTLPHVRQRNTKGCDNRPRGHRGLGCTPNACFPRTGPTPQKHMALFSVETETEGWERGQSLRCCWYKSFLSTSTKLLPYHSWSSATNKEQPLGPGLCSLSSSGIVLHNALIVCGAGQLRSAGVGAEGCSCSRARICTKHQVC